MNATCASLADSYVAATNSHDADAFIHLFTDDAVVDDVGREIRGRVAIRDWSLREIFQANVTFRVIETAREGSETTLTVEVDGDFDRTGLPNPLVMTHMLRQEGNQIAQLACRLKTD